MLLLEKEIPSAKVQLFIGCNTLKICRLLLVSLTFACHLILIGSGAAWAGSDEITVSLPNTDGYGLNLKPMPASNGETKTAIEQGPNTCNTECNTPFAKVLGEVDNVKGFSNCQSSCIQSEYSFLNLNTSELTYHQSSPNDDSKHYVGLVYQCVEYARRWWMKNRRITFGDIDSAYQIMYLLEGKYIDNNTAFELARSVNGSAKRAPKRGDLLIYYPDPERPNWRYGHVAVVVNVNMIGGVVSIAEQNYRNLAWSDPKAYSRQLPLYAVNGRYQILDVDIASGSTSKRKNTNGGVIAGWVYPLASK